MRSPSIPSGLLAGLLLAALPVSAPAPAAAQVCGGGGDFCPGDPGAPPPCYRAPDDANCNADCHCGSPDYPNCDPECGPGELCDPSCGNACWDDVYGDVCTEPPSACDPGSVRPFTFVDDQDGNDNGQIYALGNRDPLQGCGTLLVEETGYYEIFDLELSESCDDQLDETGYLKVENSCNGAGWAVERNAGERFLVLDSDNTPECGSDADCGPGRVCRPGTNHGNCCVPMEPVFMGTFLLVAGEPNQICIHHWCPDWQAEVAAGRDYGFVNADCGGVNSIHFRIGQTAIACQDETMLQACSWGCESGECLPDPCDSADCPAYCKDGVCLDQNPCDDLACEHGCVRGRCLQSQHARGPDEDGDGYSVLADCDDSDPSSHPGAAEVCATGLDEDCDGLFDETPCEWPEEEGGGDAPFRPQGGCGCEGAGAPGPTLPMALALALGLFGLATIVGRRW